jgi:hypothetical protein
MNCSSMLMSGVYSSNDYIGVIPSCLSDALWFGTTQTYSSASSHKSASAPVRSSSKLASLFTVCIRRPAGFCHCLWGVLCQSPMTIVRSRSFTLLLISTWALSLRRGCSLGEPVGSLSHSLYQRRQLLSSHRRAVQSSLRNPPLGCQRTWCPSRRLHPAWDIQYRVGRLVALEEYF